MFIQEAEEVGVEPEQNLIICDDYNETSPEPARNPRIKGGVGVGVQEISQPSCPTSSLSLE